ncbi:MAG: hypothetical protein ACI35O_01915 [Bacillaceae bacterium]
MAIWAEDILTINNLLKYLMSLQKRDYLVAYKQQKQLVKDVVFIKEWIEELK